MTGPTQFDNFADDYDGALNLGLSVTGESKEYFARERIAQLSRYLRTISFKPNRVMDYGCGTGSTVRHMLEVLDAEAVIGIDTSEKSLDIARRTHSGPCIFSLSSEFRPRGDIDLAYCNGVFHHIPPAARVAEVRYIYRCLRPGGIFAFWENNPWNPGTRYVMSRIPFDRDAITITPPEARALLREGGFDILRTDYAFYFPSWLKPLRILEPLLVGLPLGGQYQVLCKKEAPKYALAF
jgi:SAM-dependent methyltransferase